MNTPGVNAAKHFEIFKIYEFLNACALIITLWLLHH